MIKKYRVILFCQILILVLYSISLGGCDKKTIAYDLKEAAPNTVSETQETQEKSVSEQENAVKEQEKPSITEPSAAEQIYIHICGEITNPGVYTLSNGSRLYELIEKAGGLTAAADVTRLNQASILQDGEQVVVLSKEEAALQKEAGTVSQDENGSAAQADIAGEPGKINLNTAGINELMTLTGIGEARAQAIITYRETNGGFSTIEEIKNIEGIKEKMFEKIKEHITV